jgi:1-acyl-sn-glycerol-3-phosphate acyltransferase
VKTARPDSAGGEISDKELKDRVMINKGLMPNRFLRWAGSVFLKSIGWRMEGVVPDLKKFVIIAAPHTSNWDFPITMALTFAWRMKIHWMGKASLFRPPFGAVSRWLGGIAIDRSRAHNIVEQAIQAFGEHERLIMVIPPEGTRKKVSHWKTGFYHIAAGAKVPIVLGYLDYRRKVGGIGPTFHPTGSIDEDIEKIKEFYSAITGRRQEMFGNAALKS